ncbi:MAG TPA: hypothetical protein PLN93_03670 [Vicinamibacterales bacterium]|nr:hypothetical protein [Vicinamibacterales bacterium]HOQ61792.1 hypothetical protein [Vicinamibacterales bacterium]HPK71019.1 hypothetical protein [Vicinamibacterales bacterium]
MSRSREGVLDEHVHAVRGLWRERRDLRLAALDRESSGDVVWARPEGDPIL